MFTIYLVLLFGLGGLTVVSFVLGELFSFADHIFDAVGDVFGNLFGGADAGSVDTDSGETQGNPSPLSLRTIFAFGAGFGAGGLMGKGLGMSDPLSVLPASGMGLVMALVVWLFLRFIYSQQATTSIQPKDYIGLIGRVSTSIPKGGTGQIIISIKGEISNIPAISAGTDKGNIPQQTEVYITAMEGGVAKVKRSNG